MCGCVVTHNLGCFESCNPVKTGVIATVTGIWTAKVCFNGVWLKKEFEAAQGTEIVIPNDYPEGLPLKLQLLQPDGKVYNFNTYLFIVKITITA